MKCETCEDTGVVIAVTEGKYWNQIMVGEIVCPDCEGKRDDNTQDSDES